MLLDAPLRRDLDLPPRFAASAAPAAICCFLDFAGIIKITLTCRPVATGSVARHALVARARSVKFEPRMADKLEPDAALMLRVKEGDNAAFTELVDKYKQPVMNLVARMLRDQTEAEDVAQNVFVQVYRSAHRYTSTAKFSTWLFTIARNLCLNEIRRRSRHPTESMDAARPDQADQPLQQYEDKKSFTPPQNLLQSELEQKTAEAIAELPENQRLALLLCRQEDLSYEDIAKVLDCSVSATKSLIFRGRETLKARLKPYVQSGAWKGQK